MAHAMSFDQWAQTKDAILAEKAAAAADKAAAEKEAKRAKGSVAALAFERWVTDKSAHDRALAVSTRDGLSGTGC
jgi:hypothetical protein